MSRIKNESERVQQTIGVPKRQYYEKHEDDERQDHNTYTPFEFRHNQENNRVSRSRLKFVVLMRLKKNKTSGSKGAKVMIVRR